ncbi:MAG: PhnD/SsuA/transferrin family substrate-binding protein [Devosia sp.]|uniref:substrate-binding domain-containing protein n=1 Tax=Devosia sp. TaxID=1871048 RepID=UPI001AC5C6E1|nr:PhnD/SsuA/transferrin family substrate-binding protein [Devosia sp.]MBN9317858.1 PhnD/SsuA/transferrin family substrate-binding protein [Devosia sp.]
MGTMNRREMLVLGGSAVLATTRHAVAQDDVLRFALTPVFLSSDLDLLDHLKAYLGKATGQTVQLVTRRTYQEVTALLVSGQVDGAWLCGFPFVEHKTQLSLLAVPVWRGKPLYQSYLICSADRDATAIGDLADDIHAFSDPDSNSGYLVTAAELARQKSTPDKFFRRTIFTYSHFNVVRAVAAGLAQSGSVDGYVYEVLKETSPALIGGTRVVRASEWFGFPPTAVPRAAATSAKTFDLQQALLNMHKDESGQEVLAMLRLDRFAEQEPALFASIEQNWDLVRGIT